MLVKKNELIRCSLLFFILLMPFGYKLNGRFAISNAGQIISFLIILPVIIKSICKKYLEINLIIIIPMLMGALISALQYNISLHIGHLCFFILISLYMSFFIIEVQYNKENIISIVNGTLKITIYIFFIMYSIMGFYGIVILRKGYLSYLFDDKSHAVIMFAFFSFITLNILEGRKKYFISVIFFVLSLTTTSRLGIIFIPFYVYVLYKTFRKKQTGIWQKIAITFISIFIIVVGIYFIYNNRKYFTVFGRFGRSSGSTIAHIELIWYSIQIKFQNIFNFLFGTGPGSFSNIAVTSGINLLNLKRIDKTSYKALFLGTLPVHSSHFEILMDFSIVTFYYYTRLWFTIIKKQRENGHIYDFLFSVAFFGAEIFYSTFHEILFYVIILYLYANSYQKRKKL